MKSFQKHIKGFKNQQAQKCIHRKRSLQYMHNTTHTNQQSKIPNFRQQKNYTQNLIGKSKYNLTNPHNEMIKSLVAMNQDYFQDKLQVTSHGKPCKLKLKIPSSTGSTIYKKDYIKLAGNQAKQNFVYNFEKKKIEPQFFGNTTYRNQFNGKQNTQRRFIRAIEEHTDQQAPTFLNSQYKHNFLNWGTGSHMPSMKPHPRPAVTNLPLHPSTIYSTQFTKKPTLKHQSSIQHIPNQKSTVNTNTKQVQTPLLYMTTNNIYYDRKNASKQNNLKPKTHILAIGENNFKGKTEYKSEFKNSQISILTPSEKKPLKQLQNLIINL